MPDLDETHLLFVIINTFKLGFRLQSMAGPIIGPHPDNDAGQEKPGSEVAEVQEAGGLRILTWNINGIRSLADFPKVLEGLSS